MTDMTQCLTSSQCWGVLKYYLYLNIKLGKKYLS